MKYKIIISYYDLKTFISIYRFWYDIHDMRIVLKAESNNYI